MVRETVTSTPLDVARHARDVEHDAAGAVANFAGVVRDHDSGKDVTVLHYSAHPRAERVIELVSRQLAAEATGVRAISISQRVGTLRIGDVALAYAVSADHRREAFVACAALVDDVNTRLSVWKHQIFADGSEEWVNST
jgi:molybdopterin synthase catalytic subunit